MTWNVENLFPAGHRVIPQKVITHSAFQAKVEFISRHIAELAPDVLALQDGDLLVGRPDVAQIDRLAVLAFAERLAPKVQLMIPVRSPVPVDPDRLVYYWR
jgi:hypothetical protein